MLFQFARFEQYFDEAAMNRYYEAAMQPKEVKWYDCGHDLNDPTALIDRAKWLRRYVGLGEVELQRESAIRAR